jgi:hypothetical protein
MTYNIATGLSKAQSGAQSEPSQHHVGTKWATARVTARVTGHPTSPLQKCQLTVKDHRLLEQLGKEGGLS